MKIILLAFIIIIMVGISYGAECKDSKYILLDMVYEDGKLTLVDTSLNTGCGSGEIKGNDYRIDIDLNNKIVYSSNFNPEIIYEDGPGNDEISGGAVKVVEKEVILTVPAYEDSKIRIYDSAGNEIIDIDSEDIFKKAPEFSEGGLFITIRNWLDITIGQLFIGNR